MFGRQTLGVKLPVEMIEEAWALAPGIGLRPDGRRSVASPIAWLLEMYLVNHPDVLVNLTTSEGLSDLLDAFMADERGRLERVWKNAPRERRLGKRPPKPSYRGLVIAAIKEGTRTRCYGCM
jgi:hypothetical protein